MCIFLLISMVEQMFNITKRKVKIFKIDETFIIDVRCPTAMTRRRLDHVHKRNHLNTMSPMVVGPCSVENAPLKWNHRVPVGEPGSQRGGSHAS